MRFQVMKQWGVLALAVVGLVGCGTESEPLEETPVAEAVRLEAGCATATPSEAELARVATEADQHRLRAQRLPGTVRIPTYVHVIRRGTGVANGDVPAAVVAEQINVLNYAYRNTPFHFTLEATTRTTNATWYVMSPGSSAELMAKKTLRRGGKESLNLFLASPGGGVLAWSTFPQSQASSPLLDGVVLLNATLPGGTAAPTNQGDTAVHEVGHWFGLLHTSTGCTSDDGVSDTPLATPAYVCAEGRDTCASAGLDPIHNYMGYTDDACMFEFTPGQAARADTMALTYR